MLPRNLLLYRRAAWKFGRNNVKTSPSVLISSYHSHNGVYGYVPPAKAKPRAGTSSCFVSFSLVVKRLHYQRI